MNRPSLEKLESRVKSGGTVLVNSSLVDCEVKRKDLKTYYLPINEKAGDLGEPRVANMVMLGALLQVEPLVKNSSVLESLKKVLSKSKHHLLPLNAEALEVGANCLRGE